MSADLTGSREPRSPTFSALHVPCREFSDTAYLTPLAHTAPTYLSTTSNSISWNENELTKTSKSPCTSSIRQLGNTPERVTSIGPLPATEESYVATRSVPNSWVG